ncbi:serine hydrolase domain-containing protein [Pseudomonas sp. nanlin1]|uniref:serine hydrolase domain-containing protein n=1 Tax=Pseudomonas sp. nanlin1 TaxID=3040605 RepID=UPI00389003D3
MLCATRLNGKPLSSEHSGVVVPWWSFTKTVLAAAALTLVRDGLIELDACIEQRPFTLRQLLKHQAGLADYSELAAYHAAVAEKQAPWPAADMLQRLDADTLRYPPGAGWRYSNVGYLLIAQLIERVTGLEIEQALAERIFLPLGLAHVRLARTPLDLANVYPSAMASYDPGWVYHGLLVGPLAEAAALLDLLLAGPLLPASLLDAMQEAIVLGGPLPGRPWAAPGYGLGLMIGASHAGPKLTGHTGVGPGGVIAVYQCTLGHNTATCAVFSAEHQEGEVEAQALKRLLAVLGHVSQGANPSA